MISKWATRHKGAVELIVYFWFLKEFDRINACLQNYSGDAIVQGETTWRDILQYDQATNYAGSCKVITVGMDPCATTESQILFPPLHQFIKMSLRIDFETETSSTLTAGRKENEFSYFSCLISCQTYCCDICTFDICFPISYMLLSYLRAECGTQNPGGFTHLWYKIIQGLFSPAGLEFHTLN